MPSAKWSAGRIWENFRPKMWMRPWWRDHLYTAGMADPDLIIRTAGEMRLSNFLLWQSSYAELWVTEKCWPDFRQDDLIAALKDFASRDRRFGGLKE